MAARACEHVQQWVCLCGAAQDVGCSFVWGHASCGLFGWRVSARCGSLHGNLHSSKTICNKGILALYQMRDQWTTRCKVVRVELLLCVWWRQLAGHVDFDYVVRVMCARVQ